MPNWFISTCYAGLTHYAELVRFYCYADLNIFRFYALGQLYD
jgi:hypothetical protein